MIDIAQSVGIVPINLIELDADVVIGSSVKWLCGGPGAAYLWINSKILSECEPKDVGWFSHEKPFEFDIRQFRYHPTVLRFWGGTPSIAPYAIAANSIEYFSKLGSHVLQEHNQDLIDIIAAEFCEELVSPREPLKRSGTVVLDFGDKQDNVLHALDSANISVDARSTGIRISPHIYNDVFDINNLLSVIKNAC